MLHDTDDVDAEAEEVLNELNLLTQSDVQGRMSHGDPHDWSKYLYCLPPPLYCVTHALEDT